MKKCPFFLIFLIIILSVLSGCSSESTSLNRYSRSSFDLFDTVAVITGFDTSKEAFDAKTDKLLLLLEEYHQLYDIYHEYDGINNLKTVNDNAGIRPVVVDERILDLLDYCIEMYRVTDGFTNAAMGSVLSIWHEYREAGAENPERAALPSREELEEAAQHVDISGVIIDRTENTVYLSDPKMRLDVGSIAKGYATEKIALAAEEMGWEHLAFSIGGNVRTIGTKGDGTPWTAGIQNPDLSAQVCLSGCADGFGAGYQRVLSAVLYGRRRAVSSYHSSGHTVSGKPFCFRIHCLRGCRHGGCTFHCGI